MMNSWYYQKMQQFQKDVEELPSSEGRALQIVKWLSLP